MDVGILVDRTPRSVPVLRGIAVHAYRNVESLELDSSLPAISRVSPPRATRINDQRRKLTNEGTPHSDGCTPARRRGYSRKSPESPNEPVCSHGPLLTKMTGAPPRPSPPPLPEFRLPRVPARSIPPISRVPALLRGCDELCQESGKESTLTPMLHTHVPS